jgi:hypothetical protein
MREIVPEGVLAKRWKISEKKFPNAELSWKFPLEKSLAVTIEVVVVGSGSAEVPMANVL